MKKQQCETVKQSFNIYQFLLYTIILLGFISYQTVQILNIDLPSISSVIQTGVDVPFYGLALLILPVYLIIFLYLPSLLIIHIHFSPSFKVPLFETVRIQKKVTTYHFHTNKQNIFRKNQVIRC